MSEPIPNPSQPTPTPSEMITPPLITLAAEGDVILDISESSATDYPRTQYLVASQVLSAASPVFRTMFSKSSPFEEAQKLHDPNRKMPITVALEDDPAAFEVVLNVLHFRNRRVEKQPDLPMLLAIAKISDKYQLYEALMFITDTWYTTVQESDASLEKKTALAWAFHYEDLFRETTREIIKSVTGSGRLVIGSGCLPECLINAIITKRNLFINRIKSRLEFYRTKRWAWGQSICNSRCDSLQWGHFLRMSGLHNLEDSGIAWYRNIDSLVSTLTTITAEKCAGGAREATGDHSWNADLKVVIAEGLKELENGLSLSEFPSRVAE
ncbi:hypothetical protein K440DRAFT_657273 [Wilcoxina mikolae CBS 423.85]|nr:hypothetical protein K440DRAFT_657273 [Wilcoxina mikolae CBS 423.85]